MSRTSFDSVKSLVIFPISSQPTVPYRKPSPTIPAHPTLPITALPSHPSPIHTITLHPSTPPPSKFPIITFPSPPAAPPLSPHTQQSAHSVPVHPLHPTLNPQTPRAKHTSPRRVLQQRRIDRRPRQMHVSHHTAADKHVLDRRLVVRAFSDQPLCVLESIIILILVAISTTPVCPARSSQLGPDPRSPSPVPPSLHGAAPGATAGLGAGGGGGGGGGGKGPQTTAAHRTAAGAGWKPEQARTYQMRIADLLDDADVVEFDVQELVDGLEGAADGDVVFELDGDGVVDEGFEEAFCGLGFWSVREFGWGRGEEGRRLEVMRGRTDLKKSIFVNLGGLVILRAWVVGRQWRDFDGRKY